MCTWHGPLCTPSGVGKPWRLRLLAQERHLVVEEVADVAGRRRRPAPADVMQVPPSGLRVRADRRQRQDALRASRPRRVGVADDRLEVDLDQLVGEVLLASGTRAAPDSCRPSSRRSCRRWRSRHRPATRRMFSMIRSKVPWPPRSGRIRLCVSRSPSSVILTPCSPNGSSRSTTSWCQQQAVGDDADRPSATPRACVALPQPLGQVVHHRQIQQRLAAEERQHELLGPHAIELALDPVATLAAPSRATSCRRTCCSRRDRPGSSSRRRSCTAASSAP